MSRPILLLRHGSAGDRATWAGDDRDRPLDASGRRQAAWLVDALADHEIGRVLSSPFARCMQTVAPLAQRRGLNVEPRAELAEGASRAVLERLLHELRDADAASVLCTHGDVLEALVGNGQPAAKGGFWLLEWRGGRAEPARYVPPPGDD